MEIVLWNYTKCTSQMRSMRENLWKQNSVFNPITNTVRFLTINSYVIVHCCLMLIQIGENWNLRILINKQSMFNIYVLPFLHRLCFICAFLAHCSKKIRYIYIYIYIYIYLKSRPFGYQDLWRITVKLRKPMSMVWCTTKCVYRIKYIETENWLIISATIVETSFCPINIQEFKLLKFDVVWSRSDQKSKLFVVRSGLWSRYG